MRSSRAREDVRERERGVLSARVRQVTFIFLFKMD